MRVAPKLFYFHLNDVSKSTGYKKLFLFMYSKHRRLVNFWFTGGCLKRVVVDLLFLLLQLLKNFYRMTLFKDLFTCIVSAFIQSRTLL